MTANIGIDMNTPVREIRRERKDNMRVVKQILSLIARFLQAIWKELTVFTLLFVITFIFLQFFKFPKVSGHSMDPNFHDGDVVLCQVTSNIQDGDVIILWQEDMQEYVIKRVLGTEGDEIVIQDGKLYRNGSLLYESYLNDQDWECEPVHEFVHKGELFIMGDNRNASTDSRAFGVVPVTDAYGKVIYTIKSGE